MRYRINSYNKKYVMLNIYDITALGDLEDMPHDTLMLTYNIYLAWIKLIEKNNNQITTYEIALNKNNPLKKYLTKKDLTIKAEDQHILLYEDKELKEIDLSPKIKARRRTK